MARYLFKQDNRITGDKNMKKTLLFIMGMVLLLNLVFAHEHNFTETKELIDSGISCNELTDEQLESIGDYYMEQMHPGEAHEIMDNMMGGEGSESLKQVHINMAKSIYCNDDVGGMMGGGMMGGGLMGGGMMGGGMMGGGMMGNYYPQNNSIYRNSFLGFQIFSYIILTLIIVVLVLLIMLLINKSKNSSEQKGGKNERR